MSPWKFCTHSMEEHSATPSLLAGRAGWGLGFPSQNQNSAKNRQKFPLLPDDLASLLPSHSYPTCTVPSPSQIFPRALFLPRVRAKGFSSHEVLHDGPCSFSDLIITLLHIYTFCSFSSLHKCHPLREANTDTTSGEPFPSLSSLISPIALGPFEIYYLSKSPQTVLYTQ